MKLLLIIFLTLLPVNGFSQSKFTPTFLPTICLPIKTFAEGNKELGEQILLYGPAHDESILFQLYLSKNRVNPTFSAVIQKGNEICVLAVGTDLQPQPPDWWFEERGLFECEQ